jgi:hypothetical protein
MVRSGSHCPGRICFRGPPRCVAVRIAARAKGRVGLAPARDRAGAPGTGGGVRGPPRGGCGPAARAPPESSGRPARACGLQKLAYRFDRLRGEKRPVCKNPLSSQRSASDYESGGRRFESFRARQKSPAVRRVDAKLLGRRAAFDRRDNFLRAHKIHLNEHHILCSILPLAICSLRRKWKMFFYDQSHTPSFLEPPCTGMRPKHN